MRKNIAVLSGDGIGPEVMECALEVLNVVADKYNHEFIYNHALVGGVAYDKYKQHLPDDTIEICRKSDAILFGSIGGPVDAQSDPKWQGCETNSILALRKAFGFNINIRPTQIFSSLKHSCPLKDSIIDNGADIEIFRELSRDIYFGEHRRYIDHDNIRQATDVAEYDEDTIRSIAIKAFKRASDRTGVLTSVDKANVMDTSRLWREVVSEVSADFPNVKLNHMYVDNCAMQLVLNPAQFDVIVTSNMFGDILSDLASVLPGSIGLVPSISLNSEGFGMYEPSGGSAYDIIVTGKANPIAQILSASLMLAYSFGMQEESISIYNAVSNALDQGYRTHDIHTTNDTLVTTKEFTQKVIMLIGIK